MNNSCHEFSKCPPELRQEAYELLGIRMRVEDTYSELSLNCPWPCATHFFTKIYQRILILLFSWHVSQNEERDQLLSRRICVSKHFFSRFCTKIYLSKLYQVAIIFHELGNINPFTSLRGPLEPAAISGFCSVKRMRVNDSVWTGY